MLEVNLDYPSEYPLAPEKVKVAEDMLSPYAKKLLEDLDLKGTATEKLIPNLNAKKKYVVHYRNLRLYFLA